jgi:hypothetical protein
LLLPDKSKPFASRREKIIDMAVIAGVAVVALVLLVFLLAALL